MPSINGKKKIRYTAADLSTIEGAMTLAAFMLEFDKESAKEAEIAGKSLGVMFAHISEKRKALDTKPDKKPAAPVTKGA